MNILYDGLIYRDQVAGGINRYFHRLISGLPESDTPMIIMQDEPGIMFPSHPRLRVCRYDHYSFRPGRVSSRINTFLLDRSIASSRPDIFHPTYYKAIGGLPLKRYGVPLVITVHDMIHELYPEMTDPDGSVARMKQEAIMAASAIICVSQHTKHDLLRFYPIPEERISVIHHGAEGIAEGVPSSPGAPQEAYYLYVGSRAPYKNFDGLLRAFARVVATRPYVHLRVVGAPLNDEEQGMIRELGLAKHVVGEGHVDDERLAGLYRGSVAFVYPSLYEGFGIPLLEAMRYETAVIASDRSSIPEVVGQAAQLVDPVKPGELTDAMVMLLDDAVLRDGLVERGRQRIRQFTWRKAVEQTRAVYASLLGESPDAG